MNEELAISREDLDFDKALYPLSYFIGAWLGDGSFRYNTMTRIYQICYVSMDKEVAQKVVRDAMNLFNDLKEPYIGEEYTKKGTLIYRVAFCNKKFTQFICYLTSFKTQLPDFIWKADKETQLDMLAGLFDADGTIIKNTSLKCKAGYSYYLRFTGTKGFVTQFPDLCRVIGINVTNHTLENHSNPRHAQRHIYTLSMPSAINNGFRFYCKRKQERFEDATRINRAYIKNKYPQRLHAQLLNE